MLTLIIACQISFWVSIVAGLISRHLLRRRRVGVTLLLMTPMVDVLLLAAVIVNLQSGGTAILIHDLAGLGEFNRWRTAAK